MKNANITKLLFVPTGSYHDMALRPYNLNVSGESLDRLTLATDGFNNLSSGAFAGIAGSILRPMTQSVGTLSIPNGWNESRLMFMMEVVHTSGAFDVEDSAVRVQYISGYTDYAGDVSYNGRLDPNMRLYLNTVINTREFRGNQRRGVSANRYLQQNAGQSGPHGGNYFAMRPRDVCQSVGNSGLGDYVTADYRTSLSTRPLMSNVRNDLPTDYMARTFQSYKLAMHTADAQDDIPSLMDKVASNTSDDAALDDPFVLNLYRNTELAEGSCFSYGELCSLFPETDNTARVLPPADTMSRDIGFATHRAQDSQHWAGSNTETIVSTIVGSSVPSLMTDAMLTQVSFYITNDTVNGQPEMEWLSPPQSFMMNGESLETQATYFMGRMLQEIFRDLTNNGNMTITLTLFSDLVMADTRMEVQVDGGDIVPFCVPNFASSMITPVIANDRSQLDDMAAGVNQIFDSMSPSALGFPSEDDFQGGFSLGGESLGSALRTRTTAPVTGSGWKV